MAYLFLFLQYFIGDFAKKNIFVHLVKYCISLFEKNG